MKSWVFVLFACLVISTSAVGQPQMSVMDAEPSAPAFEPQLEIYTVEPGDTLWDITARVVGDPYLWPKVWSFNPEISNPHWIYPNQTIRFVEPSELDLTNSMELIADRRDLPEAVVEEIGSIEEEASASRGPEIEVVETVPVRQRRDWTKRRLVNLFVTDRELQESGVLTNARPDYVMLSTGDQIYITFPPAERPESGARYLIYRTLDRVVHPVSQRFWGYMTQITGIAAMDANEEDVTRGHIEFAALEIERGHYLTPMKRDPRMRLVHVPAHKAIDGVILTVRDAGTFAGADELVVIDAGKKVGVELGNRFRVVARGDPTTGKSELPANTVGVLQVVDVKASAATCLVLISRRELMAGDVIQSLVE